MTYAEKLDYSLDQHISAYLDKIFGEPKHFKHYNNYSYVFRELLYSVKKKIENERNPEIVTEEYCSIAADLLYRFAYEICADKNNIEYDHAVDLENLWTPKQLDLMFKFGHESMPGLKYCIDSIDIIARDYLTQDMRSGKLERMFLASLVASEAYTFGEEIKKAPCRFEGCVTYDNLTIEEKQYLKAQGSWEDIKWARSKRRMLINALCFLFLIICPYIFSLWAEDNDYSSISSWIYYYLMIAGGILVYSNIMSSVSIALGHKTGLQKALRLHKDMIAAYEELDDEGGSPMRIRDVLSSLTDKGAVWKPVVFSLLDCATIRFKGSWI